MPDINEGQDAPYLTEYPEYENSFTSFFRTVLSELKFKTDPLLRQMQKTEIEPVEKTRTIIGDHHIEMPLMEIEHEFQLHKVSICNADVDDLLLQLYNCAMSGIESLVPQMFKRLHHILDEAGQTMDAHGQPFSIDLLLDMLEKIQISFDESGDPILPTIFVNPEMANTILKLKETEEQKKQMEEILNRKREEFFATRRTRRLSRSTE